MLDSSAVVCRFDPCGGQIKDYEIGGCCFSTKQGALRSNNKDWLGIRIMCQREITCHSRNTKIMSLVEDTVDNQNIDSMKITYIFSPNLLRKIML